MWVSCTAPSELHPQHAPGCWALRLAASRVLPGLEEAVRASWVYPQKVLVIYVFYSFLTRGGECPPPLSGPRSAYQSGSAYSVSSSSSLSCQDSRAPATQASDSVAALVEERDAGGRAGAGIYAGMLLEVDDAAM